MVSMSINEFLIRLLLIIGVGFLIGCERQLSGHNISFKTTVLIAIGSFAFVSVEVFIGSNDARMAANVITGIGFLCSGVIFKNGSNVNGLNTSATLWSTSAISVLIGYGHILEGLLATALLVLLNIGMAFGDRYIRPIKRFAELHESEYVVDVVCLKTDVKKVKKIINEHASDKLEVIGFEVDMETAAKCRIRAKFQAEGNPGRQIANMCEKIFEKDVISVSYEQNDD